MKSTFVMNIHQYCLIIIIVKWFQYANAETGAEMVNNNDDLCKFRVKFSSWGKTNDKSSSILGNDDNINSQYFRQHQKYPEKLRIALIRNEGRQRRILRLDLTQHFELIGSEYKEIFFDENSQRQTRGHDKSDTCFYKGKIADEIESHVAVNLCRGDINGIIRLGDELWVIDQAEDMGSSENFFVRITSASQKDSATYPTTFTHCHNLPFTASDRRDRGKIRRSKRSIAFRRIPNYYHRYLDGRIRYVELFIVNDHSMYLKYKRDMAVLSERTKQIANIVNTIYWPLNIRIVLIGSETWSHSDRFTVEQSGNGDTTLNNLLRYRRTQLMPRISHDNTQFITNVRWHSSIVGKAMKGTMCSRGMSGGINQDHHSRLVAVATTVAHEMGHNFGMSHDSDESRCHCGGRKCIMAPSSGGTWPPYWSTCSLEDLQKGLTNGADYCLQKKPSKWWKGPMCGNGITEAGEDCDCGPSEVCDNKCCNATTCKFSEGATCANGDCCDRRTCSLKARSTICRSAVDGENCDLPEYCTGKSEWCPADTHKHDGSKCSAGFCFNGKCGNRDQQCREIWGSDSRDNSETCYALNTRGDFYGNCGELTDKTYSKCAPQFHSCCFCRDKMCGQLKCRSNSDETKLRFGFAQTGTMTLTFGRRVDVCRVAKFDFGTSPNKPNDPGMVPDGAVCGSRSDKMCLKQRCVKPSTVLNVRACNPPDCNGRGVCNNRGNCHCDFGFWGRGCERSGGEVGGSVDSGPSIDDAKDGLGTTPMVIGLAALLLVLALIGSLAYFCWRKRFITQDKKRLIQSILPRDRKVHMVEKINNEDEKEVKRNVGLRKSVKHRPAPPPPRPPSIPVATPSSPKLSSEPSTKDGGVVLKFDKKPPPIMATPLGLLAKETLIPPIINEAEAGVGLKQTISSPIAPPKLASTPPRTPESFSIVDHQREKLDAVLPKVHALTPMNADENNHKSPRQISNAKPLVPPPKKTPEKAELPQKIGSANQFKNEASVGQLISQLNHNNNKDDNQSPQTPKATKPPNLPAKPLSSPLKPPSTNNNGKWKIPSEKQAESSANNYDKPAPHTLPAADRKQKLLEDAKKPQKVPLIPGKGPLLPPSPAKPTTAIQPPKLHIKKVLTSSSPNPTPPKITAKPLTNHNNIPKNMKTSTTPNNLKTSSTKRPPVLPLKKPPASNSNNNNNNKPSSSVSALAAKFESS